MEPIHILEVDGSRTDADIWDKILENDPGDFVELKTLGGPGSGPRKSKDEVVEGHVHTDKLSERENDVIGAWMNGNEQSPSQPDYINYQHMRDPNTKEGKEFTKILNKKPDISGTFYRGLAVTPKELAALKSGKDLELTKHSSSSTEKDVASTFFSGGGAYDEKKSEYVLMKFEKSTGKDFSEPHADYPEKEVVLSAGSRYTQTGVKTVNTEDGKAVQITYRQRK
jgi:hypothetical protein